MAIIFMLCFPLAVYAQTYYVDGANGDDTNDGTSWTAAIETIQAAIDASTDGDDIWVKSGEYLLSSTIIVDVSIALYGGFPSNISSPVWADRDVTANTTTVNGGGTFRCFLVGDTTGVSATIDGFTITNGNSTNGSGGAIFNGRDSQLRISRCILTGNEASSSGGAIFNDVGSRCSAANSVFAGNTASGPDANGGAICTNAVVNFDVMNCTFAINSSPGGQGGAIYNDSVSWAVSTVTNSIFRGNSAAAYPDIANQGRTAPLETVTFCNIEQTGYDGYRNNISADPLFTSILGTSPLNWDLHLSSVSPSVDTGTALDAPAIDLDGISRPRGYGYDMGAYEYQPPPNTDISVSPSSIDFGDVLVGESASENVTISNNWDELDIYISSISVSDGTNFSVNSSGGSTLESEENTTITVSFHPGSAADFQSSLIIESDDPDDPVLEVDLSGRGIELSYYDLTWSVEGQGSVTLNPSGGSYLEGTSVEVTAVPAEGWEFDRWSGALHGSTNPETIVMNGSSSITATFTEIPIPEYDLTINVTGQGSVSLDPSGGTYEEGTVVSLTASPGTGYRLASWSGTDNDASTSLTNQVTMSSNKTVTVTFEVIPPPEYDLTVNITGQGSVSLDPSGGTYVEGTVVTLFAYPGEGYHFVSWSGTNNDSSPALTNTVTMNGDRTVTATFEPIPPEQYTLSITIHGSGSVSLVPSGGTYEDGTVVSLTAVPDTGSQFSSWSGTDNDASSALTNTVTMDRDKTVVVTFEPIPDFDSDLDGIPDDEEKGPDGTTDYYDGNLDGIPDAEQANVASYHNYDGTYYLTIASPAGTTITDVHNDVPPESAPQDYSFPFGLISFQVSDIPVGGPTTVKLYLPDGYSCDSYYKYNLVADTWEEFLYNGLTGAEIAANVITLHLVDGLRGDEDSVPDGFIIDPGTPAIANGTIAGEEDSDPDNVCFVKTADPGRGTIQSLLVLILVLQAVFMPRPRPAQK